MEHKLLIYEEKYQVKTPHDCEKDYMMLKECRDKIWNEILKAKAICDKFDGSRCDGNIKNCPFKDITTCNLIHMKTILEVLNIK